MNLWHSFEQRLCSIANGIYEDAKECNAVDQSALLFINLLFTESGSLAGWYRPQKVILEPKHLNPLLIEDCQQVQEWSEVISELSDKKQDRILIIRYGKPLAWLT